MRRSGRTSRALLPIAGSGSPRWPGGPLDDLRERIWGFISRAVPWLHCRSGRRLQEGTQDDVGVLRLAFTLLVRCIDRDMCAHGLHTAGRVSTPGRPNTDENENY